MKTQKETPTFHCILTQMYLEFNSCNQTSSNKQQGESVWKSWTARLAAYNKSVVLHNRSWIHKYMENLLIESTLKVSLFIFSQLRS